MGKRLTESSLQPPISPLAMSVLPHRPCSSSSPLALSPESPRSDGTRSRSPVHVRFRQDVQLEPDKVHLKQEGPNPAHLPEIHVGLLLVHHQYEVIVSVDHDLGENVVLTHPQHNIVVKGLTVGSVAAAEDTQPEGKKYKHTIKLAVNTLKDGHLEEQIELTSEEDETKTMQILVTATVLAIGKGNPLLKDGVHCVGHEHLDDSELSDWHGHKIIA